MNLKLEVRQYLNRATKKNSKPDVFKYIVMSDVDNDLDYLINIQGELYKVKKGDEVVWDKDGLLEYFPPQLLKLSKSVLRDIVVKCAPDYFREVRRNKTRDVKGLIEYCI